VILQCWGGVILRYFTLITDISKSFTMAPKKSCSVKESSFKLNKLPVLEKGWISHPPLYSLTECA